MLFKRRPISFPMRTPLLFVLFTLSAVCGSIAQKPANTYYRVDYITTTDNVLENAAAQAQLDSLTAASGVDLRGTFKEVEQVLGGLSATLYFNDSVALFLPAQLGESASLGDIIARSASKANYNYYQNQRSGEQIRQKARNGEVINLVDTLTTIPWKITSTSAEILGHTCFKAKANLAVEGRDGGSYVRHYEAWFAPALPFPYGPINMGGLPGVILLATHNGKIFWQAVRTYPPTDYPKRATRLLPGGKRIESTAYGELLRQRFEARSN